MTQEELNKTTSYMDMVRNHREKAFDEGVEAMRELFISVIHAKYSPSPENPYEIKEKKKEEKK